MGPGGRRPRWTPCGGSAARSPAWGSAQVNEPLGGPAGSKSSPAEEEVGEAVVREVPSPPQTPAGWVGSGCRGQPPAAPTSLPAQWGDPALAPSLVNATPRGEAGGQGRPGVARAAQQRGTSSAVLDPTQLWLHNLCSPESASRHLWKFHKAFVCLLPSPPISQRNRIKFIDLSTYYLFHQLYCGGEEGPAGEEAGGSRPPPPALGGFAVL